MSKTDPVRDPLLPSCEEIESYFDRLWPILRSITGDGVRETHDILGEIVPLERIEIPSGTKCFDWTIPDEWNVREAYIASPDGQRVIDIADNNLHLVNYSVPFEGTLTRQELDKHLHSIPDLPDAIPYVTSYYNRQWGFCLGDAARHALPDQEYTVVIDADLKAGSMTLSEAVLPGTSTDEILVSTYTCHPSMANNELSGPLVSAFLFRALAAKTSRHFTYRFVYLPETIGSIAYLSRIGEHLRAQTRAGFVLTCLGDPKPFTYKRSRHGDSLADKAAQIVLRDAYGNDVDILDFFPSGSDERQYCSPGFDLPVGVVTRSWPGRYREYHTFLDNKACIDFNTLRDSVSTLLQICDALEKNRTYRNTSPYGEPNLGRRGLMSTIGASRDRRTELDAMKWVLNLSDGSHDLLGIAERSKLPIDTIAGAAELLAEHNLLESIA